MCAAIALLAVPIGAPAHDVSAPTTVTITGDGAPGTRTVEGQLTTSKACRAGRRIEVLAKYGEWTLRHVWGPGEWTVVDRTRSGATGTFAAAMSDADLMFVRVRAKRDTIERRGHRHVCRGAFADRAY